MDGLSGKIFFFSKKEQKVSLQCQIKKIQNPQDQFVTVGESFLLFCESQEDLIQVKEPYNIEWNQSSKYQLIVKKVDQFEEKKIELLITSVVVGPHNIQNFQIKNSDESFIQFPDFNFEVKSIQNQSEPITTPFGPFLLQKELNPNLYWSGIALLFFFVLLSVVIPLYKKRTKKNQWTRFLSSCDQGFSPSEELIRNLKQIRRSFEQNKELNEYQFKSTLLEIEKSYFIFIGRLYQQPLIYFKIKEIEQFFQKNIKSNNNQSHSFYLFFKEIQKIKKTHVTKESLYQIFDWIQDIASDVKKGGIL